MRRALLLASLLALPAALADAGAWYDDSDTLTVSTPNLGDATYYRVFLQSGDTLRATLAWSPGQGSPYADVALNNSSCSITNLACLHDRLVNSRCDLSHYEAVAAGTPIVVTARANFTTWYQVRVAGFLVPDHLDYHLHLQVNGAAPASVVKEPRDDPRGTGPFICWRE